MTGCSNSSFVFCLLKSKSCAVVVVVKIWVFAVKSRYLRQSSLYQLWREKAILTGTISPTTYMTDLPLQMLRVVILFT